METSVVHQVRNVNAKLQSLLQRVNGALTGRRNFTVEDVRAIAEPVADMAPIVSQAQHLRATLPELKDELETYAQNLGEMDKAFDRVRCVVLARCASLEAERGHLETVGLWADAWRQTR